MLPVVLALSGCATPNLAAFAAQPQTLPTVGGQVELSWHVEGASLYTLSSTPPLPGLPLSTNSSQTTIQLASNNTASPRSYQLILEASTPRGIQQFRLTVSVEGQNSCPTIPGRQAVAQAAPPAVSAVGLGRFDKPFLPGRLLAFQRSGLSLQSQKVEAQSLGAQWVRDLGSGWGLYRTQSGQEARVAARLVNQGLSQFVQPEFLYQSEQLPSPPQDRSFALEQASLFRQMNWEQAWQKLRPGCFRPVVAVVDTGVFTERSDLFPNLTPPSSWLDVVGSDMGNPRPAQGVARPHPGTGASHGTQVASIIAATTNDGLALAGAAYNLVQVLPIKVFDAQRRAGTLQLAQALEYAAGATQIAGQSFVNPTPAQVVNLSLSISGSGFSDPYLEQVLERLSQQGLIVVASSGNAGLDSVGYPASSPQVIAVGATDGDGARARWFSGFASNYGADLEFMAPGTGVPVLHGQLANEYALAYGTSAAAPFVSTVIALYIHQREQPGRPFAGSPGGFLAQVRRCLQSATANASRRDLETGFGLIDVAQVVNPTNPACFPQE